MFTRAANAALLLHVCFATLSISQSYEVIELQKPGGATYARARDINEAGVVVGTAGESATWYSWPVVWQNGLPNSLTEPQLYGGAHAINEAGTIAGTLQDFGVSHVALWSGDSVLFLEGPNEFASGDALNDAGVVAGSVSTKFTCCEVEAFRSNGGVLERLPHAPGGRQSFATGINAAGEVVGYSERPATHSDPNLPSSSRVPALWTGSDFTQLGDIPNGILLSEARDINDAGTIVGFASDTQNMNYAVRWDNATPVILTQARSVANAINTSGDIVGRSQNLSGEIAALWAGGAEIDLNAAITTNLGGCVLREAVAINDAGQIVAVGFCPEDMSNWSKIRSYLLTPEVTEEPDRTPAENLELLAERIGSLSLGGGLAQSFLSKIDAALASLARGAQGAACNQLDALANAVAAQSGKALSSADAQAFLDEIAAIRTQLGC